MRRSFDWLGELRKNTILRTLFVSLLFFVLVFPLIFFQIYAPDAFKSLYTARYIAQFLELPHHSSFTFSPVKEFFPAENFNWLGHLVLYGLYQIGDFPMLQLFRVYLVGFYVLMALSIVNFRLTPVIFLLLVTMVYGSTQKLLMRNAIFLVPYGITLLWLWHQSHVKKQEIWIVGFPILFLFWGNTHGTFLVGLGLLGLMVGGNVFDGLIGLTTWEGWNYLRDGALMVLLVLIVTFLKPYPDQTILRVGNQFLSPANLSVFDTLGISGREPQLESEIERERAAETSNSPAEAGEKPLESPGFRQSLYRTIKHFLQNTVFNTSGPQPAGMSFPLERPQFLFMTVSVVLFLMTLGAFAATARHFRLSEFLPFIAGSIIGFGYVRTVVLIPLVCVPILLIKRYRGDFDHIQMGRSVQWTAMVVVAVLLGNLAYNYVFKNQIGYGNSLREFGWGKSVVWSERLPRYVLENYPDEKMYNSYGIGTYLIWKWWPDKKVLIDGKNLAYKPEFYHEVGTVPFETFSKQHDLKYMLIPTWRQYAFRAYIPNPEWEIVAFDRSFIFLKYVADGQARDVDPQQAMLYSEPEYQNLPRKSQIQLGAMIGFIRLYQNKEEHIGKFQDPFQRLKKDLERNMN